jgi:hypothetical protein
MTRAHNHYTHSTQATLIDEQYHQRKHVTAQHRKTLSFPKTSFRTGESLSLKSGTCSENNPFMRSFRFARSRASQWQVFLSNTNRRSTSISTRTRRMWLCSAMLCTCHIRLTREHRHVQASVWLCSKDEIRKMIAELRPIADSDAKRCGLILPNGRRSCKVVRVAPRNDRQNLPLRDSKFAMT